MFKNYLKTALRNLTKYKVHSIINILGLAIGLAFCTLTFIFISHERSYDRFHSNGDRIYLAYHQTSDSGRKPSAMTPRILAPTLKENLPGVESIARVSWFFFQETTAVSYGDISLNWRGYFVDPEFLRMFSFPRVAGSPESALESLQGTVISESMAETYFNGADPLGKEIFVKMRGGDKPFIVRGVIEVPTQSSLHFDFLLPLEAQGEKLGHWGSNNVYTFVQLTQGQSGTEEESRFLSFFGRLFEDKKIANEAYFGSAERPLRLLPLKKLYLSTQFRQGLTKQSDPIYSAILAAIALAVLFIACVNFVNLSLGLSSFRFREIGMRKVVGARRAQLIRQHLSETLMLCFMALLAGILLAAAAMPVFCRLMERDLAFQLKELWFPLLSVGFFTGLLAGIYPAFVISGFKPVSILKGHSQIKRKRHLSSGLVIAQFALSTILIISTLTMSGQMRYMSKKDLGFDAEQVLLLDGGGWIGLEESEMRRMLAFFRQAASGDPELKSVTMTNMSFGQDTLWATNFIFQDKEIFTHMFSVDYDYLETLGIELVRGREFSQDFPTDKDDSMMINESMARSLGFEDPIGQRVDSDNDMIFGKIIGVVKNSHLRSLHFDVEPAVYHLKKNNGSYRYILLRVASSDYAGVIKKVRALWKQTAPHQPFVYSFLDDEVDRVFKADQRWAEIASYSALFSILIACLGAFGLISLSVSQRTKEVGIRKVLGAGELRIAGLLSRDFSKLLLLANIFAWPLSYLFLHKWLQNFAYRIDLSWAYFILGTGLTFLITCGSISLQIFRASKANPVDSLRFE